MEKLRKNRRMACIPIFTRARIKSRSNGRFSFTVIVSSVPLGVLPEGFFFSPVFLASAAFFASALFFFFCLRASCFSVSGFFGSSVKRSGPALTLTVSTPSSYAASTP